MGLWRSGATRVRPALARMLRDRRGGMALMTAIALPPLLLIGVGAVELQAVAADRAATQNVADQAALWGAGQLSISPVGLEARTEAFASPQLQTILARADVRVQAQAHEDTVRVTIDTHRPSFFMNLMPAGGFNTHAEAVAQSVKRAPLCVLTFGERQPDQARLQGGSLEAGGCMVHARGDIKVASGARLTAMAVETEDQVAMGAIQPSAGTDAPPIADPFAQLQTPFSEAQCQKGAVLDVAVTRSKPLNLAPTPGGTTRVVQGKIDFNVDNDADAGGVVTFAPGEYFLCRGMKIEGSTAAKSAAATAPASSHSRVGGAGGFQGAWDPSSPAAQGVASVVGDDVVLVFADGYSIDFRGGGSISLNGRKTGALAGFVMMANLVAPNSNFYLDADEVQSLLGTIYQRQGLLHVRGNFPMTAGAAWTVVAANQLILENAGPGLVINSNYSQSNVPRPVGVGDATPTTRSKLVR